MQSVVYDLKVSGPKIATALQIRSGKTTISSQTIRRVLENMGYNSRTARSKPYISAVNEKKVLCLLQNILIKSKLIGSLSLLQKNNVTIPKIIIFQNERLKFQDMKNGCSRVNSIMTTTQPTPGV